MSEPKDDRDATAALDAVPSASSDDVLSPAPKDLRSATTSHARPHLNDPRHILPVQPYKGTSLWRKLIALVGLGAFSVLGGLVITLVVGIMAIVAALVVQAAIS